MQKGLEAWRMLRCKRRSLLLCMRATRRRSSLAFALSTAREPGYQALPGTIRPPCRTH